MTFEDVGSYETTKERNLTLNGIFYQLIKIIEAHGSEGHQRFWNPAQQLRRNMSSQRTGFNLMRFKADIYGAHLHRRPHA